MNIELRPLSLSEILDRTFQLYRARFTLFVGISAVSTILGLFWSALQLSERWLLGRYQTGTAYQVITVSSSILGWAFGFGCAALATAAINRAVLAMHEGKPVSIAGSYQALRGHWFTCIWVSLLAFFIAWSPMILVALGVGVAVALASNARTLTQANAITFAYGFTGLAAAIVVPLCVWLSLRYSLAVPACIQESIGTVKSLKRSAVLSRDSRGRIFVLLLVVGVAWSVLLMSLMIPVFGLLAKQKGHVAITLTLYTLAVSFVCNTLLTPAYGIGLTLFYYDARVRKEGYDVEWMLEHAVQPSDIALEPLLGPGPDTVAG